MFCSKGFPVAEFAHGLGGGQVFLRVPRTQSVRIKWKATGGPNLFLKKSLGCVKCNENVGRLSATDCFSCFREQNLWATLVVTGLTWEPQPAFVFHTNSPTEPHVVSQTCGSSLFAIEATVNSLASCSKISKFPHQIFRQVFVGDQLAGVGSVSAKTSRAVDHGMGSCSTFVLLVPCLRLRSSGVQIYLCQTWPVSPVVANLPGSLAPPPPSSRLAPDWPPPL